MNIWLGILIAAIAMSALMTSLWFVQRARHNAGIVDIAWSFGTGLVAIWFAYIATGDPARRWIVGILAGIWGVRLGFYLLRRLLREEEDGRYQMLRERWGERTQFFLFWFFQIQAFWAVMFAAPMLIAAMNPNPAPSWLDFVGIGIWMISIAGETIADAQLAAFKSDSSNKGKVCKRGLWRYSRHPNYFFEWIHWWAYVAIGITWTWGWLTLLGPVIMLFFLLKVTGIPLTEKRALQSRGEAYREYQRTTNAFFPGPPKDRTPSPA